LRIGIQQEHELAAALIREQVHGSSETVIVQRPDEMDWNGIVSIAAANKSGVSSLEALSMK